MTEVVKDAVSHFDAFISYSRKDKAFAQEIEKTLENFKPPKDLDVPQRVLNIFRDEGDMTGTDYYQSIEKHLANASKLIVICSQNARESEYVNDEILRFVKGKDITDIIPVLLKGIPNNLVQSGQEKEMAFPQALCEIMDMPLAVSYTGFNSKEHKADKGIFEDSWYTILANIYEVSRSEIEQRDKKRRASLRRNRTIVLTAIVLLVLSVSFYGIWQQVIAKRERMEADLQTKISLSRHVASQSRLLLTKRPDLALLLSVESFSIYPTISAKTSIFTALTYQPHVYKFFRVDDDELTALALSSEGKLVASGSVNGKIYVWDIETGKRTNLLSIPSNVRVNSLAFCKDDQFLISSTGDQDGEVTLWDIREKSEPLLRSITQPYAIRSLTTDIEGKIIATAGWDNNIRLFSSTSLEQILEPLEGHKSLISSLTFSPDGQFLLSGGAELCLWEVSTGKLLKTFYPFGKNEEQHAESQLEQFWSATKTQYIEQVVFGPEGQIAEIVGSRGEIVLLNIHTITELGRSSFPKTTGELFGALGPDGKTIITGGNGYVRLWDAVEKSNIFPPIVLHDGYDGYSWETVFSLNGNRLASMGVHSIVILDYLVPRSIGDFIFPLDALQNRDIRLSSDGKRVAYIRKDESICVREIESSEVLFGPVYWNNEAVELLDFSQNGLFLAAAYFDGTVILWDLETGQMIHNWLPYEYGVSSLCFAQNDTLLIIGGERNQGTVFDIQTGQISTPSETQYSIVFYNVFSGDSLNIELPIDGNSPLWSIVANFRNEQFCLGTGEVTILWSLKSFRQIDTSLVHPGLHKKVAFSPRGNYLASSSGGTILIWDIIKEEQIANIPTHPNVLETDLAFSQDGRTLASSGSDGIISLWDVETGEKVGVDFVHEGAVSPRIAFGENSKTLISASHNGVIKWNIDIHKLILEACAIANNCLSPDEWNQYFGPNIKYDPYCNKR